MALFPRDNSGDLPLLKSNLPASTGPAEPAEDESPPPAKPKSRFADSPQAKAIETMSPAERRQAMKGLDQLEVRWSVGGFISAAVVAVIVAIFFFVEHGSTHTKKGSVSVAPDAALLAGVVLVFCVLGYFAVRTRRRTLVAFSLAIVGFAFTLTVAPLGFAYLFLGGWLMWRAFRIQRYGTPDARQAAKVAATRPTRKQRQAEARTPPTPSGHKKPTPSKRYTPKQPARKKIPKPTQ